MARARADRIGGWSSPASVAMLVAALAGIAMAGRSFLPEFNEGALTVSAVTIPGTSLADSNALGDGLERLLLRVPEVASTGAQNRQSRARRARAGRRVGGDRRASRHAGSLEGRGARRDSRTSVAAAGHQRDDRPADLASHRPHAVGHAGQCGGEDLRRRPAVVARSCGAGAGRDGAGRGRRRPVDRSADRNPDAAGQSRARRRRALRNSVGRGGRSAADGARRQSRRAGARRAGRVPAGDSIRPRRPARPISTPSARR